jgi:superfamily II DNA helicase RecQ
MGKTTEFRSMQKKAVAAIVAEESPVVAVMPIERGKSLLFILLVWAEQGRTTIVIVLLIALRGDIMR